MPARKIKEFPLAFKNFREDLCPIGIRRVLFLKSEWNDFAKSKGVTILYLIYRGLYMIYFQFTAVFSYYCHPAYYYTYFTYWTIITQAIYGTLFFIEVSYHYILEKLKKEDYAEMDHLVPNKLTALETAIWVLFSIVSAVPLVVSIGFWWFVFPAINHPSVFKEYQDPCNGATNYLCHVVNSVFCILDLSINALPFHVTHFVYVMVYAGTYTIFTGIYEVAVGRYAHEWDYIYPTIDWKNKPWSALGVGIGVTLFGFIVHLLLWTMYIFRLFIVNIIFKYDVYSYHEYTYRRKRNNPSLNLNQVDVEVIKEEEMSDIKIAVENEKINNSERGKNASPSKTVTISTHNKIESKT